MPKALVSACLNSMQQTLQARRTKLRELEHESPRVHAERRDVANAS
jgi:hypothetical protein